MKMNPNLFNYFNPRNPLNNAPNRLGPIKARRSLADDQNERKITLKDENGKSHALTLSALDAPIVKSLRFAETNTNAIFVFNGNELNGCYSNRLEDAVFSFCSQEPPSTNDTFSDFNQVKQFCDNCNTPCADSFKSHLERTCSSNPNRSPNKSPRILKSDVLSRLRQQISIPPQLQTSTHQISNMQLPTQQVIDLTKNYILLPITTSASGSGIQLLGSPQLIIPVAIGRDFNFARNPLIINPALCQGINVPSMINLGNTPYSLNISTAPQLHPSISEASSSTSIPNFSDVLRKRTFSNDPKSVDVSTSNNSEAPYKRMIIENISSLMNGDLPFDLLNFQNVQSNPTKKFHCKCSASFHTQQTYDAHVKNYCKNRTTSLNTQGGQNQSKSKTLHQCNKCSFVSQTHQQLYQHMKSVHCPSDIYSCKICSYIAYSLRTIKIHLREHPQITENFEDHYKILSPNEKNDKNIKNETNNEEEDI